MIGALCQAQTGPPTLSFAYKGPTDQNPIAINAGDTLIFPATVAGSSSVLQFFITNKGMEQVQLKASTANAPFTVSAPASGVTVLVNQIAQLTLTFAPKVNGALSSKLTLQAPDGSVFAFLLTGTGVAPILITSYQLNPAGNQVQIGDGGIITFPATQVSQTSTATVAITNRGTAPGTTSSVAVSGAGFQITGLALVPVEIAPGSTFQFTLVFAPNQAGQAQGSLQIALGSATETISLTGQGTAATYGYQAITGSSSSAILPNGTVSFPQTQVNQTSSLVIQISNTGTAAGGVNSVTVIGAGFQVSNLNPLPLALPVGVSATFTVNFTPSVPGAVSGRLIIDSATFTLSGSGLGPQLVLSFVVGSSSTPIASTGTASFPNTMVGSTTTGVINIQNAGNAAATINSIGVSAQSFGATIPALPVSIAAGGALSLPVVFAPNTVGTLTGSLTLDSMTVTLKGIGTAPANLPSYAFAGVGGSASPMTQPAISLSLASPYPTDITGTLTLTFAPNSFVDDPTIQFASGGRTVSFKIPANATSASFGSGSTSVQFQTGTVAGTITITPAFSTGTVSLTPLSPMTQSIVISAGPPSIRNVQLGTTSASSFELLISGFSTPRSVTQVNLQFVAAADSALQTTSLTVNTDPAFTSWYQTVASGTVGSQFTVSITIGVTGNIGAVQSVAVSAVNANGLSNSMSVSLH